MKKFIAILMCLAMLAALTACGASTAQKTTEAASAEAVAETETAAPETEAVVEVAKFGDIPAGIYTYVNGEPKGEGETGEIQFVYNAEEGADNVFWAAKSGTGSFKAEGDVFKFFEQLYISGRPMYDWLASNMRSTEGFEGNLNGQLQLTFSENNLLSGINANDGTCNVVALITKDIVEKDLVIEGSTRGQPNLLQSSVTVIGSANCIEVTRQGNAILDNLYLYGNDEGIGLKASKIGGDVFVVGKIFADAEIQWYSRYGNIQAIKMDAEATIETNGQNIDMRGANIGRMRSLNLISNGGDIIIGTEVSTDQGRGGDLEDKSTGTLSFSSTGIIDAGDGDVLIGTNDYRVVSLDLIGGIIANNVTIKPTNNGTVADFQRTIGNIKAAGDVDIEVGSVNATSGPANAIGDIEAGGNVMIKAGVVNGYIGRIDAKGDVKVDIAGCANGQELLGTIKGAKVDANIGDEFGANLIDARTSNGKFLFEGSDTGFTAYVVNDAVCVDPRDVVAMLAGSPKESYISWTGELSGTITINIGKDYVSSNLKNYPPAEKPEGEGLKAAEIQISNVYINSVANTLTAYSIDGKLVVVKAEEFAPLMGLIADYTQAGDLNFKIAE